MLLFGILDWCSNNGRINDEDNVKHKTETVSRVGIDMLPGQRTVLYMKNPLKKCISIKWVSEYKKCLNVVGFWTEVFADFEFCPTPRFFFLLM